MKRFLILISLSSFYAYSDINSNDWDAGNIEESINYIEVAKNPKLMPEFVKSGEKLFSTKFNIHDGAGRPGSTGDSKPTTRNINNNIYLSRISGPDATSCAGCHNEPRIGGSGDFITNAFVGAHFSDPPSDNIRPGTTNERNTTTIFGSGLIEILAKEIT
ncbi:MAG: hypothetical protein WAT68_07745, partial [Candidatus Nitrotoga sp.]